MKLVQGFGKLDSGEYKAHVNKVQTREYRLWCAMLRRCYSANTHESYPTYEGCKVSENFKSFQFFAKWCNAQIGFDNVSWKLDKDIIGDGITYSEDVCVFVPNIINNLFVTPYRHYFNATRGLYEVRLSIFKKTKYFGSFANKQGAEEMYTSAKKAHVSVVVDKFRGVVDPRVVIKLEEFCKQE